MYILCISFFFLILTFVANLNTSNQTFIQLYSDVIVRNCKVEKYSSICYGNHLSWANQIFGFKLTLKLLKTIQIKDFQANHCHSIAHKIAQSEIQKNPGKWLSFFKQLEDPYMCFTGFIHGAIEGKKRFDPKLVLDKPIFEKMCQDIINEINQKNPYPCAHALGHVLLVEQHADLSKSINICQSLSTGLQRGCLDGLFMELILKTNLAAHGLVWPQKITDSYVKEIESICANYDGNTAESCWREISQAYYMLEGPDLIKLKNHCQHGGNNENIKACYFRSFNFSLVDKKFDHSQLSELCSDYANNEDDIYNCYDWAITGLILTSPKYIPMISELCNKAPATFYDSCWKMKEERLKMYSHVGSSPVAKD